MLYQVHLMGVKPTTFSVLRTECHDTNEISLEVALNTINQTKPIHVDVELILSDKVCQWLK